MEQNIAEIEKQFSRLDEAIANLDRVKASVRRYVTAIFEEAFAGPISCTLGDVIASGPQNGLYLPKSKYGEGTPILRIDDYQTGWCRPLGELRRVRATPAQMKAWTLDEGDVIINRVNSPTHLGKCLSVSGALRGALFESNMMRLRLRDAVLPRYMELYLGSKTGRARLTKRAKWAVNQASINQRDVRSTPIPLPPLAEQQRVVADMERRLSIVRAIEAEADANHKRAATLRQAVLSGAFVNRG
jgi:type I restriction enzyme S subunit